MHYSTALESTFQFIENHLEESFQLDDLTRSVGFSKYHFSRLFHSFTGYTLGRYIKMRRLNEAAKDLIESETRILDLAIKYQFSSQESFTRSFSGEFGVTPARYRKLGNRKTLLNPIDVSKIILYQGGMEVKPEVKIIEPLHVVGMVYEGMNFGDGIPKMWQTFLTRIPEIKDRKDNMMSYGLCEPVVEDFGEFNIEEPQQIRYMAGVEVNSKQELPEGMDYWEIKHTKYAVFAHIGDLSTLGDTYKAIYSKWIPECGYEVVVSHDFEVYDKDFKPGDPKSKMYIYVPIK